MYGWGDSRPETGAEEVGGRERWESRRGTGQGERGWSGRGREHAIGRRTHRGRRAVAKGGEGGVDVVAKDWRGGGEGNGHTYVHDGGEGIGKRDAEGGRRRAKVEEG